MDKAKVIDELIALETNSLTVSDRAFLESLTEDFLAKLTPTSEEETMLETQEEHDCKCGKHIENEETKEDEELKDQEEEEVEAKEEEEELKEQEEKVVEDKTDEEVKEVDVEKFLAEMPDEVKAIVGPALEDRKNKRNALIERIVANSDFSKEELENESDEKLNKLASLAKAEPDPDYSGAGGPRSNVQDDSIPPAPAIVLAKPKKKESVN